jgi:murein DD-endopeptidase MepM/ murein hydrolase activator NlpD
MRFLFGFGIMTILFVGSVMTPVFGYSPPVVGPIVDRFRPSVDGYGPGNSGIDYQVGNDVAVKASEDGVVAFAGQVGGRLFVVVNHADGLRSTYGYLRSLDVEAGEHVVEGQMVGTASGTFHFGFRRGDQYLDPEPLLAGSGAHLVPSSRN